MLSDKNNVIINDIEIIKVDKIRSIRIRISYIDFLI